jgi:hypothetical protein
MSNTFSRSLQMVAKLSNIMRYWSTTRHGFDKHVKKKFGGGGGKEILVPYWEDE